MVPGFVFIYIYIYIYIKKNLHLIIYSGTLSAVFQNCISKQGTGGQILNTNINKCSKKVHLPRMQTQYRRLACGRIPVHCCMYHKSKAQETYNI
jgi:hypothetical protein